MILFVQQQVLLRAIRSLSDGLSGSRSLTFDPMARRGWLGTPHASTAPVSCTSAFSDRVLTPVRFAVLALVLLALLAAPGLRAADAEEKKEEKLGTVIGIDLGTTCALVVLLSLSECLCATRLRHILSSSWPELQCSLCSSSWRLATLQLALQHKQNTTSTVLQVFMCGRLQEWPSGDYRQRPGKPHHAFIRGLHGHRPLDRRCSEEPGHHQSRKDHIRCQALDWPPVRCCCLVTCKLSGHCAQQHSGPAAK